MTWPASQDCFCLMRVRHSFFVKEHDMHAHLTWLRQWAIANEQQRWNIVYKLHYLGHIAEQAQWLSPRAGSTYIDEDFMGRMKNVATKCTGGSALYRLGNIILAKYSRGCSSGGV